MKKILLLGLLFAFVFASGDLWAQERTVSGQVTSQEDGSPLPGVTVTLSGTTIGTITDMDGNYQLSVPEAGGNLVFTFVGFATQEVAIGTRTAINVSLAVDAKLLDEVVITAQGIAREKRSLGYGVTQVQSKDLEQRAQPDVARVLQGKVPGVAITSTGGVSGSATNIIIRGYSSLSGSNQPLFVVDGVPFNSGTNENRNFVQGGQASTSRFFDLDPNSIESVNVLKGLSAAVLYGDQGRNGVILVTTKSGSSQRKPAEVVLTQSVFGNQIASLPDYTDQYGNGFNQNYGAFFSNWGPAFSSLETVPHPYSQFSDAALRDAFPQFEGQTIPYEARDGVRDFFRTGITSNTSLNVSGSSDKIGYNLSLGYTDEQGFVPGNDLTKFNIATGINAILSDKFSVNTSIQFFQTDIQQPPLNAGFGSQPAGGIPSVFGNILYTPVNIAPNDFPFENPIDRSSVYYRAGNDIMHPNWLTSHVRNLNNTQRFFASTALNYDVTDNIAVTYRVGLDTYNETREYQQERGGTLAATQLGVYTSTDARNTIWNNDLFVTGIFDLSDDLTLSTRLGANMRYDEFVRQGLSSINQIAFGLMRHTNFVENSARDVLTGGALNISQEETRYGLYADINLDYRNFLYLNLLGRNDWTSTLEQGLNTIFYPGVSVAFIPTSAFAGLDNNSTLNYMKVRAGYGTSAGFPTPYRTRNILDQNARAFINPGGTLFSTQGINAVLGNPLLEPELHEEIEVGIEATLFNKLGIDLSLYTKDTRGLITQAPLDPSTGFTSTFINVGKIRNEGIELQLSADVIRRGDFNLNLVLNFNTFRSTTIELSDDLDQVQIAGFGGDLGNYAIPGEPFNIMYGIGIARDEDGNRIVGNNGSYVQTGGIVPIGNPIPDFTSSLIATASYKNLSLNVMFDYVHGGDIYSMTTATMMARGMTKDTDDRALDRNRTFILPGVKTNGEVNDIQIDIAQLMFDGYFFQDEPAVWDATTIRLRELALTYDFPQRIMQSLPFKGASISLIGNNLWFRAVNFPKYSNFDPDVLSLGVGNGLGFDFLTGPSRRSYGASLRFRL
jgi:TonB-linked SusC/RagA family outer membrane protein